VYHFPILIYISCLAGLLISPLATTQKSPWDEMFSQLFALPAPVTMSIN
jgi:hypothetical protein